MLVDHFHAASKRGHGAAARCAVCGLFLVSGLSQAASLQISVQDSAGNPLPDAVVYALPEAGAGPAKGAPVVEVEQNGRKFLPMVTALQMGTSVSFPNHDTVRHHIYSFSAAKKFEMKLYSGVPSETILFDKAGTVVLGCNIHDKMIAYIHVVETPYFAKSDAQGKAKIDNLPKGKYQLKSWHYGLPTGQALPESALQMGNENKPVQIKLAVRNMANAANPGNAGNTASGSEIIY